MKPSVSHSRVLFFPCVVQKATSHVDKKALNMRHQAQKGFRGIFIRITQHQKGYLVYIPITRKIISSYDAFFAQPHSEAMTMCLSMTYTTCATSARGCSISLKRGIYYLKLVMMRKEVMNPRTFQV